jgi:GAF domain-containing protein
VAVPVNEGLQGIVDMAIRDAGVASAVIFVIEQEHQSLTLAAAAGIAGPPLEALTAAVASPAHPIARTVLDEGPSYDVKPTAPGGPALRSHLPLRPRGAGQTETVGVLAVAHDDPLSEDRRATLERLAAAATARLAPAIR